jgi:hypothetical protein
MIVHGSLKILSCLLHDTAIHIQSYPFTIGVILLAGIYGSWDIGFNECWTASV